MKTFKKIFIFYFCLSFLFIPKTIFANENDSFVVESYSDDNIKYAYTIAYNSKNYTEDEPNAYIGERLSKYKVDGLMYYNDGVIFGNYEWENPAYIIKEGEQTVTLKFTNFNNKTFSAEIYLYGIKDPKTKEPDVNIEDQEVEWVRGIDNTINPDTNSPSLTATSLLLDTSSTYDINVDNKLENSTYSWTSSNTKVATVNSKTGVVKGIKDGKTKITCKVKSQDGDIYTLTSDVVVGLDDESPVLSDTDIDLSVGDKYDVNVENQLVGSRYKYVSSNKTIATVNTTNGLITAKGEGNAIVRCIITTQSKKIIVLNCNVTITK
jgi:uncharacterized protein YjdB